MLEEWGIWLFKKIFFFIFFFLFFDFEAFYYCNKIKKIKRNIIKLSIIYIVLFNFYKNEF
jgi:hypothetical protein